MYLLSPAKAGFGFFLGVIPGVTLAALTHPGAKFFRLLCRLVESFL
jgi:hypothetical protein